MVVEYIRYIILDHTTERLLEEFTGHSNCINWMNAYFSPRYSPKDFLTKVPSYRTLLDMMHSAKLMEKNNNTKFIKITFTTRIINKHERVNFCIFKEISEESVNYHRP